MLSSIPHELTDPSILMVPSDLDTFRDQMPVSPAELAYQGIQYTSTSPIMLDFTVGTTALPKTTPPLDPFNRLIPTDEVVQEIMSFRDQHWEDWHHHVPISDSDMMPLEILSYDLPKIFSSPYAIIQTFDAEGNMGDTSRSFPIDILVTTSIVENTQMQADCSLEEIASSTYLNEKFHDDFLWSHEEMPDFNMSFVMHEIQLYNEEK